MTAVQRNNVRVLGSGERTLMFAHGCDQNMWRHLTPAFESDYKIVLFDYVGSGHADTSSFDRTKYSTLHGYAQDDLDIITELKLNRVNFIAHSVSSMIGTLAAIDQPERFESLTMIGPSPSYINDGAYVGGYEREEVESLLETLESNHLGWSSAMAPAIRGNPESPKLAAELEASLCRMDPPSPVTLPESLSYRITVQTCPTCRSGH